MRFTPRGSESPQSGSKKAAASSTERTAALLLGRAACRRGEASWGPAPAQLCFRVSGSHFSMKNSQDMK